MYTLPKKFREAQFFAPVLYKLCEMVAKRLRKQELMGNVIHFYARPAANSYSSDNLPASVKNRKILNVSFGREKIGDGANDKDYEGFGQSRKLGFYVYDGREIFLQCMNIFEGLGSPKVKFKLIGITVAGLCPYIHQLSLFGHEERLLRLTKALDKINGKYGDFTVCRMPVLAAKDAFHDSIGFGRIKEK
jgi:hypothetical protein